MLTRMEAHALRRRVDAVMQEAGALSLRATHRTFRDQAALVEIDALDVKYRLWDTDGRAGNGGRALIERELIRLERRCADLSSWLSAQGPDAEIPAPHPPGHLRG